MELPLVGIANHPSSGFSIMLDLNSPRWSELKCACGSASDLLNKIHTLADSTDRSDWDGLFYGPLVDQNGVDTATFAAFPHIVAIAEAGRLENRIDTLVFAGVIRVHGRGMGKIPDDLIADFESAMVRVRAWSLSVIRDARQSEMDLEFGLLLQYLLQAFGGLRCPKSGPVRGVERLYEGDYELESQCPTCKDWIMADLSGDEVNLIGGPELRSSVQVDRSNYPQRMEVGHRILNSSDDPAWEERQTADVLAALASECGDSVLATTILDLETTFPCLHCSNQFTLSDGIWAA